jgi:hypothetical protein
MGREMRVAGTVCGLGVLHVRPFYRRTPFLLFTLAFVALLVYFFIPTTLRDTSSVLTLHGQETHWPGGAGEYSVIYTIACSQVSPVRLKSVRFIPERSVPGIEQVNLRVETLNAIPKEQQRLAPGGAVYDLVGRMLSRDEQVGFEIIFDPVEASGLQEESWDPFRIMPHTEVEVFLTFRGHPYRVVLPLQPLGL